MNRHLVLGGSGFIGRHVALALLRRGETVVVADVVPPPEALIAAGALFRPVTPGGPDWPGLLADCGVVHHYAWSTVPATANANPIADLDANLRTFITLLEAMRQDGPRRLVFAASGGTVYGRVTETPVAETAAFAPVTAYGASKAAAELYLGYYQACHGIDCRVARISNPFGAGQALRGQGAVTTFVFRALSGEPITIWGDGAVVRDYIHVADLVAGLLALTDAPRRSTEQMPMTYNLGSGVGLSLNDLINILRAELGADLDVRHEPGRPFDVPVNVLDISRAKADLGWRPQLTFREGCARMIRDLRHGHGLFSTLLDGPLT